MGSTCCNLCMVSTLLLLLRTWSGILACMGSTCCNLCMVSTLLLLYRFHTWLRSFHRGKVRTHFLSPLGLVTFVMRSIRFSFLKPSFCVSPLFQAKYFCDDRHSSILRQGLQPKLSTSFHHFYLCHPAFNSGSNAFSTAVDETRPEPA